MSAPGSDARRDRRGRPRRPLRKRGLVVAEGTRTEVQYVDAVKQLFRASFTQAVGVTTVGVGQDPLKVVHKAQELRANAARDGEPFDWCCVVVDVDQHESLPGCLGEATRLGIEVVVSNPSFEVWLLWHYSDHTRFSRQDELAKQLSKYGCSGKNLPASFPFETWPEAMVRATQSDPDLATRRTGPNPSSAMPFLLTLMGAQPVGGQAG